MSSRKVIKCLCGKKITTNIWKIHLKSQNCSLCLDEKARILNILNLKTQNLNAWKISQNISATVDTAWYLSVINKETQLEDWSFITPRPLGSLPPLSRKIHSERMKKYNRSKPSPNYNLAEIRNFTKEQLKEITNRVGSLRELDQLLKQKYSKYTYWMMLNNYEIIPNNSEKRISHFNAKIAYLLEISYEELQKLSRSLRGKIISKGQKSSEKHKRLASKNASLLNSRGRISKMHKILFEMVKEYDPSAEIEIGVKFQNRWKSYDINSPKIKAFIEMHGRIWHDLEYATKKEPRLVDKVKKNTINDILKKHIAALNNKQYIVFWDDQFFNWNIQLNTIYNENKEVDIEKIANQIGRKLRNPSSL